MLTQIIKQHTSFVVYIILAQTELEIYNVRVYESDILCWIFSTYCCETVMKEIAPLDILICFLGTYPLANILE